MGSVENEGPASPGGELAEDESGGLPPERRRGDDPFLPEEGFAWWFPRAAAMLLVGVSLVLLGTASVHHGQYRLVLLEDGGAQLERGRFAPWGWESEIPDGALEAWAPVRWPAESVEAPLDGELRGLAETFLGFVRRQGREAAVGSEQLGRLEEQERELEVWYRERFSGDEPPAAGSLAERRAELEAGARAAEAEAEERRRQEEEEVAAEAAASAAAELAEAQRRARDAGAVAEEELRRARSFQAARRAVLRDAELLLEELQSEAEPSLERDRDRAALEAFIESMDTPVQRSEGSP